MVSVLFASHGSKAPAGWRRPPGAGTSGSSLSDSGSTSIASTVAAASSSSMAAAPVSGRREVPRGPAQTRSLARRPTEARVPEGTQTSTFCMGLFTPYRRVTIDNTTSVSILKTAFCGSSHGPGDPGGVRGWEELSSFHEKIIFIYAY